MILLHIFHSLQVGGAQVLRISLIKWIYSVRPDIKQYIVAFEDGPLKSELSGIAVVKIFRIKSFIYGALDLVKLFYFVFYIKPQVIHSLPWLPNFISRVFLKALVPNALIVCDIHGIAYLSRLHNFIDTWTCSFADYWIFVSDELRDSFVFTWRVNKVFSSSKMIVIENFVDEKLFQFNLQRRLRFRARYSICLNEFVVGIVARLDFIKRVDYLITSLKDLLLEKKIKLFICGQGPNFKDLISLVSFLGLRESVFFVNYFSHEIIEFYSGIDVICLTSISEGQPLVILEGSACGLPVIVSSNLLFLKKLIYRDFYHFSRACQLSSIIERLKSGSNPRANNLPPQLSIKSQAQKYVDLYFCKNIKV